MSTPSKLNVIKADLGFALMFYPLGTIIFLDRNDYGWIDFVYLNLWLVPIFFRAYELSRSKDHECHSNKTKKPSNKPKKEIQIIVLIIMKMGHDSRRRIKKEAGDKESSKESVIANKFAEHRETVYQANLIKGKDLPAVYGGRQ